MTLTEAFTKYGYATDKQTTHSYGATYDRIFEKWRDRPFRILELGTVMLGGGDILAFLGCFLRAKMVGIDMLAHEHTARYRHVQGDAYDPSILSRLTGTFDIIIDDALHDFEHQKAALGLYSPLLSSEGVYVIEDVDCNPEMFRGLTDMDMEIVDLRSERGRFDDMLVILRPVRKVALSML